MRIVIFVAPYWHHTNPIELTTKVNGLETTEKLETYGRGWANTFPTDIVMLVEGALSA